MSNVLVLSFRFGPNAGLARPNPRRGETGRAGGTSFGRLLELLDEPRLFRRALGGFRGVGHLVGLVARGPRRLLPEIFEGASTGLDWPARGSCEDDRDSFGKAAMWACAKQRGGEGEATLDGVDDRRDLRLQRPGLGGQPHLPGHASDP